MSLSTSVQPAVAFHDVHGLSSMESEVAAPSDEESMHAERVDVDSWDSHVPHSQFPPEPAAPQAVPLMISCFACRRPFPLYSTGLARLPSWPWQCHMCEPGPELIPHREHSFLSFSVFFLLFQHPQGFRDDDEEE